MDIPRTSGGDALVDARIGILRSMLLRHAAEDPDLGYCQGMNFVAAVFAADSKKQNEAYARFKAFMHELRDLWMPGFPLLEPGTAQFQELSQSRKWYHHLEKHGVEPCMYLPQA